MAPGARSKFGAPSANLRPFGSKCSITVRAILRSDVVGMEAKTDRIHCLLFVISKL